MSNLYPTLEDLKVDQIHQAQNQFVQNTSQAICAQPAYGSVALYPSLDEYMGIQITPQLQQQYAVIPQQNQVVKNQRGGQLIAPVSGNDVGIRRAEIQQGIRNVILCKDQKGMVGLRMQSVNKGLFVSFVHKDSPAAMAGVRFGDQILQINQELVAGWSTDKAMSFVKKCSPEKIDIVIRDRPFERTITMQKDSTGHVGFVYKDGRITSIVKDSSAARNGVLVDHNLLEVDGQNVVGLKDKEIADIFDKASRTVTITLIPSFIYDVIVKNVGSSLIKKVMDHSIPDV